MIIRTGFLVENLTDNVERDREIDVEASAKKYKILYALALSEAYPLADIEVTYQEGSGYTPFPLQTYVEIEEKDREILGHTGSVAPIIKAVNYIGEKVYLDFESWVVEK